MARVIDNQTNLWGKPQGIEAQRSDLWIVDFRDVLTGLNANIVEGPQTMSIALAQPYLPPKLATYYAQSVALPELKIRSDPVRRDSRPYQAPSWDEPVDAITMNFILDCYKPGGADADPYTSDIYQMLDLWRACVRAGRGSMSEEYAIRLNANYSANCAFTVYVNLLRAANPTVLQSPNGLLVDTNFGDPYRGATPSRPPPSQIITNDLAWSMRLKLVKCWLSGFKLSELSYEAAKVLMLNATFYADDVCQEPKKAS